MGMGPAHRTLLPTGFSEWGAGVAGPHFPCVERFPIGSMNNCDRQACPEFEPLPHFWLVPLCLNN